MNASKENLINCGKIQAAEEAFAAMFSADDCCRAVELNALFVRAQSGNEDGARAFYEYAEKYNSAAGYAFSYLYERGLSFIYRAGEFIPKIKSTGVYEDDKCYKRICAILSDEAIIARGLIDRAESVFSRERELFEMSGAERFEAEHAASKELLLKERKLMKKRLFKQVALNTGRLIAIGGLFAIVIVGILVITDVISFGA